MQDVRGGGTGAPMIASARIVVCVAMAWSVAPEAGTAKEPYRDPFLQPFASSSLWNTSIGGNARWSRPGDPDTRDLQSGKPAINAGSWSMPYFIGKPDDPALLFRDRDPQRPIADQTIPAPPSIHPALPPDGDRHIIVFSPSGRFMSHYYGCDRSPEGFDCALAQKDDACRDGLGGYGWGTGVIRRWELASGRIDHMLRFSLPFAATKSGGNRAGGEAWPATGEDYVGPTKYSGQVLFGSTIGIPASVDIGKLHLSPSGLLLARTLQDYGARQRDTGGTSGLIFYAEEAAEGMPQLNDMRRDLPEIARHLAVMRNQGAATPNGGGVRRRPPVPPVDPRVCPPQSRRSKKDIRE